MLETECGLCEIGIEAENTVSNLNKTIEYDQL
jgi:hypothetical protein